MFIEHRKSDRRTVVRERAEVDVVLDESKRLIAEIDVLLEHSHDLMNQQSILHRSWSH